MPDLDCQIVIDTSPLLALCAACGDFMALRQLIFLQPEPFATDLPQKYAQLMRGLSCVQAGKSFSRDELNERQVFY